MQSCLCQIRGLYIVIVDLEVKIVNLGRAIDLRPRKKGQAKVLHEETPLKHLEVANKLGFSTMTVSMIEIKL